MRAFLEPFVVPVCAHENGPSEVREDGETYPCATTTQRFRPLMLPHIPPPSSRFSARALIVFRVGGSALLQWGTRPHLIECITSAGSPGCARRMTGA